MSSEEIFEAVSRDRMFYESSGGGVTFSGGEALLQPQLVREVFEKCRKAGIHTCIETSGQAPESALTRVLECTDYVLFDLKLIDPEKHRLYTGNSNELILKNAAIAAKSGVEVLFRLPLIPGINDDRRNIEATADFLRKAGNDFLRIELMPYHRLGKGKYDSLDKQYLLPDLVSPSPEQISAAVKAFADKGITCKVSR
jgi:pyruvate formate lyase activating enzyme